MTDHIEEFEELLPFYALGVLTEAEEAELQAAIAANASAQTTLAVLNYAVDALPYSPNPMPPSPQLKQQLLARIGNETVDQPVAPTSTQAARPVAAHQKNNFWRQLFRQPLVPLLAGLSIIIIVVASFWVNSLQREVIRLQGAVRALQNDATSLKSTNEALQGDSTNQGETLTTIDSQLSSLRQENDKLKAQLASHDEQLTTIANDLPVMQQVLATFEQNQSTQQNNLAALATQLRELSNQNVALARALLAQRTVMAEAISPNVQVMALTGTDALPEAVGQLFANPADKTAALVVYGLPALEPGKVYKFWLVTGDQPQEAGNIQVDANGLGMLVITAPEAIETYDGMGISIEPASATNQPPENDMIMVGNLSS